MSPIKIDPEIMGGLACFNGTRVPISILFEFATDGGDLEEFFEGFPSVTREQAEAVLKMAQDGLISVISKVHAA